MSEHFPEVELRPASRGLAFWVMLSLVVASTAGILSYNLGKWPWDKDEVDCLVELGVRQTDVQLSYASQITRLPQLIPVWYSIQRVVLKVLPADEFGSRCLPALCALLTVVAAFLMGRQWRGDRFALSLVLLIAGNQCFVWLAQFNRFYSMALLFLTLSAGVTLWRTQREGLAVALSVVLAALGVLSHNLLVVVHGIGFLAAAVCWAFGMTSRSTVARTAAAAAASAAIYLAYLRPIMNGWISGGSGDTPALVSFAAQLGIPTIALAAFGIALALRAKDSIPGGMWWCVVLAGGVAFVGLSTTLTGSWGPRYSLFFMPPFWFLAALGVSEIAGMMRGRLLRWAWFVCVFLLLSPKLASHFRDGSRHDFRAAAAVVSRSIGPGEKAYCNFPLTLDYYLTGRGAGNVEEWWGATELPTETCLVVWATNAFEPALRVPNRTCETLERIGVRRFDEQSHIVQIYRVWSVEESAPCKGPRS